MSADNGIYILWTPGLYGVNEFRVAHLQAVENVYWDTLNGEDSDDPAVHIRNARQAWGKSPVYTSRIEALDAAADLLAKQEICEYGISFIRIDRPFMEAT